MKQLKKVGAVLLALAMIAVMIPQMGSTVKAASQDKSFTASNNSDTYFTSLATKISTGNCKATGYTKAIKLDNAFYNNGDGGIKFTITAGKFATVTVYHNEKTAEVPSGLALFQVDEQSNKNEVGTTTSELLDAAGVEPTVWMYETVCTGGSTFILNRSNGNQSWLYELKVTEYDTEQEAQDAIAAFQAAHATTKVTVSGTITSEVDISGGIVKLKSNKGAFSSSEITKKDANTYAYTIPDVDGDMTYSVEVLADAIIEGMKNINAAELEKISIEVAKTDITKDFDLKYKEITNTWDFVNDKADYPSITIQKKSQVYKGLVIDATATGQYDDGTSFDPKFVFPANTGVQVNDKTIIKVPVSGSGSVTFELTSAKLASVNGKETSAIQHTGKYSEGDAFVVFESKENGLYVTKITIQPSEIKDPITTKGASVRQETAEWGNGIRFGGQLDLSQVAKDTCESGTLIGLEATVGEGVKMTITDVDKKCVKVVRKTYIEETATALDYAAALINIPDNQLDTKIVARPYVTIDGITYYGGQISTTYNTATQLAASAK